MNEHGPQLDNLALDIGRLVSRHVASLLDASAPGQNVASGSTADRPTLRTAPLAEEFIEAKVASGSSPKTIRLYKWTLFGLALQHRELPLDPRSVSDALGKMRGKSDETGMGHFSRMRAFYNWLVRWGHISGDDNPINVMDRPIVRTKVPRVLSQVQLRSVVEASRPGHERALILLLVDTGARVGEAAGLTKAELAGNSITLTGKNGSRRVPLSPEVQTYLEASETQHLFPRRQSFRPETGGRYPPIVDEPANSNTLYQRVHRVMKRSGLSGSKLGPHLLRHSFATAYIDNGGDTVSLARILGHTTTRMTEKYVTLSMETLAKKHAEFGPIANLASAQPFVPVRDLPQIELSREIIDTPIEKNGKLVQFFLVQDRRKNHTFNYIRGRAGKLRWPVESLGTDLPVNIVDAYRQAIARENQRRREAKFVD